MKTLIRSVNNTNVGGEPLPAVFKVFQNAGLILRRAEVTVIAGTPGAGKSSIALAIAAKTKLPTLYFSADTNAHTMAMRLIAMTGNISQQQAEQLIKKNPAKAKSKAKGKSRAKGNKYSPNETIDSYTLLVYKYTFQHTTSQFF